MSFIETNAAKFYYQSYGEGAPVICVSGYTCDQQFWLPIVEQLSASYRVITFDNRGVGQTTDKHTTLSAQLMAKDVVEFSAALGLNKPHIISQSMGGTIAQTMAAEYPDQLDKLVLLTTSAKWRKAMLFGFKSLLNLRERGADFETLFEGTLPWIFGDDFLQQAENISALKAAILENVYPQSLADQQRQFAVLESFNGINALNKIQAKTLVGYGIEDLVSLPNESKILADNISDSSLVAFNCAHGITNEVPEQLTSELLKFLAS